MNKITYILRFISERIMGVIAHRSKVPCEFIPSESLYRQRMLESYIYSPSPLFFQSTKTYEYLCENIYFYYYLPIEGDTVVDIGAGLGSEAVWLLRKSKLLKYIAIDAEPHLFPSLIATSSQFPSVFIPCPYAIDTNQTINISDFDFNSYQSGNISRKTDRSIPAFHWKFLEIFRDGNPIDLLKINHECPVNRKFHF